MVAQTAPGTKADLKLSRNGKAQDLSVTLGELPAEELATARGAGEPETHVGRGGLMNGVEVAELDRQTRRQLNIPSDVTGLVITDVEPGSAAERAGLRAGDVIEQIDRKPVRTLREATKLAESEKSGTVLLRVWSNGGRHYVALETSKAQTKESR